MTNIIDTIKNAFSSETEAEKVSEDLAEAPVNAEPKLSFNEIGFKIGELLQSCETKNYVVVANGVNSTNQIVVFAPSKYNHQDLINLLVMGQCNVVNNLNQEAQVSKESAEAPSEASSETTEASE